MVNYEYFKNKTNGNLLIFCQSTSRISTYFRYTMATYERERIHNICCQYFQLNPLSKLLFSCSSYKVSSARHFNWQELLSCQNL